jgi:predicted RNA-binding Zn ribbon-like protein
MSRLTRDRSFMDRPVDRTLDDDIVATCSPDEANEWVQACPFLGVSASVSARDLRKARELREAIWSSAEAVLRGARLPPKSARLIAQVARCPDMVPTFQGGAMAWVPAPTGGQVLSRIARDAIELFGTQAKGRLRQCKNPKCFLFFVDASRPGRRVWCTMRRCGNLNKLARYRSRPASSERGRAAGATRHHVITSSRHR